MHGSTGQKATLKTFSVSWRRSGLEVEALGGRGEIYCLPLLRGTGRASIIATPEAGNRANYTIEIRGLERGRVRERWKKRARTASAAAGGGTLNEKAPGNEPEACR